MAYIDGLVTPVPAGNKDAYLAMATKAAALFRKYGAVRIVENWGDDVPEGKATDFRRAVAAEEGEAILFSWIEWPSKEARNEGWGKCMADPEMKEMGPNGIFDGKRMIYGGFSTILDEQ